jgi:4-amino-4-deoxy-L-arabinose transferase-like glycosyltransferase
VTPGERGSSASERSSLIVDVTVLILLVAVSYAAGLTTLMLIGEESRRARGAINMIESGDWVVVRQQGVVFPDRPPVTNWLIATTGLLRGEVDRFAIRAPSVVATLLTTLLIYGYTRRMTSRFAAVAAAVVYATFGQVLQLGGLGESESVFTLLIAASLLLWHLGYAAGWPRVATWCAGYACAAVAALSKGTQAPVYFVAPIAVFLLLRGQWRWLLGWQQWAGLALFVAIIAAWQVPYYLATDQQSVADTWFAVVGPRLANQDLLAHVASYPLETFVSLAPWSLLLLLVLSREVRAGLPDDRSQTTFLLVAILVTYPTLWFASGAVGRYYMPLYPCIAILIGMILDTCTRAARDSRPHRGWRYFLHAGVGFSLACGLVILLASFGPFEPLHRFRQGAVFAIVYGIAALLVAVALVRADRATEQPQALAALVLLAGFLGLTYNGAIKNVRVREWIDMAPAVAGVRERISDPAGLVSFGPLPHDFTYHYGDFIPELAWPLEPAELPGEVDFFSFNRSRTDTAEEIVMERGMKSWTVPGTLPFVWEEIGRVPWDRKSATDPRSWIIVGRVVRGPDGTPTPAR